MHGAEHAAGLVLGAQADEVGVVEFVGVRRRQRVAGDEELDALQRLGAGAVPDLGQRQHRLVRLARRAPWLR